MMSTPESPLSYLGFQLVLPSPALRPYVRSYWYFCREEPLAACHGEFMHPTGGYGLAFNLGDRVWLDGQPVSDPVFLDGTNTVSRKMGFLGRVEILGVRFLEGGAYPFLGIPLHQLRNQPILLDALERPGVLQLWEQILETESMAARIQLLEAWLVGRLGLGRERHAIIPASLARLQKGWQQPIPRLARELAIGQRQLERLYQVHVGMSPKQYAQLQRVERARLALKGMNGQTTTWLAAELGYHDQSHFIREFRGVIGITPYTYLKHKRDKASV